jgi:hypothetical protein
MGERGDDVGKGSDSLTCDWERSGERMRSMGSLSPVLDFKFLTLASEGVRDTFLNSSGADDNVDEKEEEEKEEEEEEEEREGEERGVEREGERGTVAAESTLTSDRLDCVCDCPGGDPTSSFRSRGDQESRFLSTLASLCARTGKEFAAARER